MAFSWGTGQVGLGETEKKHRGSNLRLFWELQRIDITEMHSGWGRKYKWPDYVQPFTAHQGDSVYSQREGRVLVSFKQKATSCLSKAMEDDFEIDNYIMKLFL